jgi:hypothetical protein
VVVLLPYGWEEPSTGVLVYGPRRLAVTLDWQLGTCPVPVVLLLTLLFLSPLIDGPSVQAFVFPTRNCLGDRRFPSPPLLPDITMRNEPPVSGSVLEVEDFWPPVGIRGRPFIFLSLLLSDSSGVNGQPAC